MKQRVLLLGGCGYVGSALRLHLDAIGHTVGSVDLELRGNPTGRSNINQDYRALDRSFIETFDTVIMLAASSSVLTAINDPTGVLLNNVVGFWELLQKLDESQQFVYASSGSVYDGSAGTSADENWPVSNPRNMYDLSKMTSDFMAAFSNHQYYGLRFATVCGVSPNIRAELILNKMTADAVRNGIITVANPNVYRPCLGVSDLCRSIEQIIASKTQPSGCYNLTSVVGTVHEFAKCIANKTNAQIELVEDSPTYNFSMSGKLASEKFGIVFKDTVDSIVDELIDYFAS